MTKISNPNTLKGVASHLEKNVIRQSKQIAKLRLENARLRGQDLGPQMELTLLKEQLKAMKRVLRTTVRALMIARLNNSFLEN